MSLKICYATYPREELLADGKVPWKEFAWQQGRMDGDLEEEELHPPTHYCGRELPHPGWHRDDEDEDRDPSGPRTRSFMGRVSSWIEGRGRGKEPRLKRGRSRNWFRRETSRRGMQGRDSSTPPSRGSLAPDERRAVRQL
jgi:hypothetical protein